MKITQLSERDIKEELVAILNEEPNQFKFKKKGIDKFETTVKVKGKEYTVTVEKNGNRWIAKYGHMMKPADTKRFAVIHLLTDMRKAPQL